MKDRMIPTALMQDAGLLSLRVGGRFTTPDKTVASGRQLWIRSAAVRMHSQSQAANRDAQ
jgi:hypothetical protein